MNEETMLTNMLVFRKHAILAVLNHCAETGGIPYISCATLGVINLPDSLAKDESVTLNIGPASVQNFEITNEVIMFSCTFSGVSYHITIPMGNIVQAVDINSKMGMSFNLIPPLYDPKQYERKDVASKPSLKVVK